MLQFSQFVAESHLDTLYVFDIDDTLFRTNILVHIRDANGRIVKSLNTQEFNQYKLQPSQRYDFSDFRDADKFERTSKPIIPMIVRLRILQKDIENTNSKIVMITGRSDFDDKDKFLDVFRRLGVDIDKIHIYRAGNLSVPESIADKKAAIVKTLLNTEKNYRHAVMYDDNIDNLETFKKLGSEFPDVSFTSYQAFHDGSLNHV
mgnify:CR=1 FL=1